MVLRNAILTYILVLVAHLVLSVIFLSAFSVIRLDIFIACEIDVDGIIQLSFFFLCLAFRRVVFRIFFAFFTEQISKFFLYLSFC